MTELVKQLVCEMDEMFTTVYILNIYKVYFDSCHSNRELHKIKVFKNMRLLEDYKEGLVQYLENNGISGQDNAKFIGYTTSIYYSIETEEVMINNKDIPNLIVNT